MDEGFWTGRGAPSTVDWCEPNYVVSPYVAEWGNTWTSLIMVALGLWGLWCWWRDRSLIPRRYAWCFAGLTFVGAGSMAFHATLLRLPQALDELPMVYFGLAAAWVVWHREAPREAGRPMAIAIAIYALAFTVAYALAESSFLIFLTSYSLVVAYVSLAAMLFTWVRPAPRVMVLLLAYAAGAFLGTLFFSWIPEHVVLACDHPAQRLHLHGVWHFGAGTGTYAWCLWAIADRWRLEGVESRFSGLFVRPVL